MDLYIDGNDVYYCPDGDGNAVLAVNPEDQGVYAIHEETTGVAPLIDPASSTRTNMQFPGPGFARLQAPAGSHIVQGIIAQVLPNGETPDKGPFLPGLGNSPMELRDNPSITNYSAVIPNAQIGIAATFVEVGAWQ